MKKKELTGGYDHTKFDLAGYDSLQEKSNVKFLNMAGQTAEH